MSNYLSVLPTELIEKIFDYISIVAILSSVYFVNKRLHSICRIYSRFQLDFSCIVNKKKQFEFICNRLPNLTTCIASLTFADDDKRITHAKIVRFFCSIAVNDIFPNLHSITFDEINSDLWNAIRIRLPTFISLRSMSIDSVRDSNGSTSALMSLIIHDLLFTVRSLKYLIIYTLCSRSEKITISSSSFSMEISVIECLTIKGISINLHQLFLVAPKLRQLDVDVIVNQFFDVDMIFQSPFNLQQLSLTTNRITMFEIRCLLVPMTRLTHLTLCINSVENYLINGHASIDLLTRIIVFQFEFRISNKNDDDLDSFRTYFWLEEKKWYVTFDQWIDISYSILYTHPYYANYCYPLPFMKKILVTQSIGLIPATFPNTKYLFFDCRLPMQKVHLCRFTHVRTLSVDGNLDISLEYITRSIDLSRITCFMQGESETERLSNRFVRILHNLPCLRSLVLYISTLILLFDQHWPQIINLNMKSNSFHSSKCLSSIEIDTLWRSFTHLQQLGFGRQSVRDLSRLFNNMTMTLSNIWIRHYDDLNDYNPQLITRQWLEQNTNLSNFDYFNDNERVVYLWF